ncbi:hypothetical protein OG232_04315 [Streptomyces sp. NBC_01411]|uniref:hypothetical protein n=1 Tax=Streptomyces sp. NBC_01411 TaxID=2903857 RepID=UPI00324AADE3
MPEPKFRYVPDNEEETRFKVYSDTPDDGALYYGIVYQTADNRWVADWTGRSSNPIALPGLATKQYAASMLHWFAPPVQSFGSRPAGQEVPTVDERTIDTSQCGCCMTNHCECEGLDRVSQRFDTPQSYALHPSLIPEYGLLVSLLPMAHGDFLVDLDTRGAGSGIGYLQQRDDGRYDVRVGARSIGIAERPETGMWVCLQAFTATKRYSAFTKGFNHHPVQDAWVNGTITFRGETVEAVREAVDQAVDALIDGHTEFKTDTTTYDVALKAAQ